jgi:hypothetical protein
MNKTQNSNLFYIEYRYILRVDDYCLRQYFMNFITTDDSFLAFGAKSGLFLNFDISH